ncbi:MAG: hypothetical protein ACK4YF_01645 [Exilispira sp.]
MDNINLSIFGATGFIGSFVLSLIDKMDHDKKPEIFLMSGYSQIKKLVKLQEKYRAKYLFIPQAYKEDLLNSLPLNLRKITKIITSFEELYQIYYKINKAKHFIINGIIGINGMIPTFLSQHFNIYCGCANKESIIVSYELFDDFDSSLIFPLDSEHNAIYQLLPSCPIEKIEKIYITGSGGKVYGKDDEEINLLDFDEILNHPNWNMGARITIDSSSGINKTFEFIEVQALFSIPKGKIEVLIDTKSQIHAIIQDINNSYYIAASYPDMLLPIAKFLEKIGLNPLYKTNEIINKSIKFDLSRDIEKTYPLLTLFVNNYKNEFIEGTILLFLNSYLQDLFFSKKINFQKLRKLLIDSYKTLFINYEKSFNLIIDKNNNLKRFSFREKEDYNNLLYFTNHIFKNTINFLKEKKILEEQW